ncbi:hypothetical protein CAPTEDRAFT_229355 [Capitella teleta]|uniref:Thiolase N-terminal domain-containing protein n=1 Tax=Capitella teleta TaxID=283909 RepID=R7UTY1_CAPTE|nr:hypothetical protein CAPTEDRAFT_229355 [Capitella teleta]|eukprot:ELU09588.1 hypothetical protein CAPTEDRAFT_229355 [Capitella teleta]
MDRIKTVAGHLSAPGSSLQAQPTDAAIRGKFEDSDDDVVIVSALRTPICRAKRGGLKDSLPDDLLTTVFTATLNNLNLDPKLIEDICIGNVLQPGAGANVARIAQFFSNIPETVSLYAVNRQCSSGLQACANIAGSIKAGNIDIGLAGGVESMSTNAFAKPLPGHIVHPNLHKNTFASHVLMPVGITSENVAERYGITRQMQDEMSMDSHRKAAEAQAKGYFDAEIVPVHTKLVDKNGDEQPVIITKDDGVRKGTTMEILARLKPAFKEGGTTTAGNSSQVSDGAAAVLMARRSAAKKHGLPILGVFRSFAVVGVPPDVMGIGPAVAIPAALKKAGLAVDDIDVYEINEAFASQARYCVEKLGIPMEKVNPKGGAIALGHPLGCTGARQMATLLHEMKRRGKKRSNGVISMCIGTGMGAAAVIEYTGN